MAATIKKQDVFDWEKFRHGIKSSTPVKLTETAAEKKKRIDDLEADPEAWKRYYFPKYFKFPSPEFHVKSSERLLHTFLSALRCFIVRSWARGLAKTTRTMMDVLYLVFTGKLRFIVYTAATYAAACNFLTRYQCELDSNQRLINDYGEQMKPGFWANGDFTTRLGVRFLALGAGQSPRGANNEEIRPDCLIIDDFDTDEECRNKDIIDQKYSWFEEALLFTVDPAEPFLIIWNGNIIAEDCCVTRAGAKADFHEIINIRNEEGVSVWPEKNTEEMIDYLLSIASYEAGQKEYFNNPISKGRTFDEMKFGRCPPLKSMPFVMIYNDPATSNKDKPTGKAKAATSCKATGVIASKDGITFYVYKAWVNVVNNSTFVNWMYDAAAYASNAQVIYNYVENNTLQDPFFQQVLKPLVLKKQKERGLMIPLSEDDRDKPDKFFRIEGTLEPIHRAGNLIFNEAEKDDPHMKRLVAQFKAVSPTCKTMDGPDMVEGGVTLIKNKLAALAPAAMVLGAKRSHSKRF